jgi:hypothetical protein
MLWLAFVASPLEKGLQSGWSRHLEEGYEALQIV